MFASEGCLSFVCVANVLASQRPLERVITWFCAVKQKRATEGLPVLSDCELIYSAAGLVRVPAVRAKR